MHHTSMTAAVTLLAFVLSAEAREDNSIDKSLENISGQYAECAAYFRLVYHALVASNDAATAGAYRKQEDTAMFYSLLLANEGRDKDTAVTVTNARIEMYMKVMKKEANNRNENIAILINKYSDGCEKLMTNPPAPVHEVMGRRLNEEAQKEKAH